MGSRDEILPTVASQRVAAWPRRQATGLAQGLSDAYRDAFADRRVAFASPAVAAVGGLILFYGVGFAFTGVFGPAHGPEILVGLVVAVLGMLAGIGIGWRRSKLTSAKHAPADTRWLLTLGVGLTVVGLAALILYLTRIGDLPIFMSSVEQGRVQAATRGGSQLRVLAELAMPGAWLLTALAMSRGSRSTRVAAVILAILVAALHLATANRANAFLTVEVSVVITLLCLGYRRLNLRVLSGVIGTALVMVLAAGFVGGYRLAHSPETWNDPDVRAAAAAHDYVRLTELALRLYLIVPVQNTNYAMEAVPDPLPWRLGYTYIQPLLTALPGHQTTFDQDIKAALGQTYAGGGTVPSLLGEAYANFGPFGWLLVPLLLGFATTWLYRRASAYLDPAWWALYAYVIVAVVNANIGGLSVANIFPFLGTTILAFAIAGPQLYRRATTSL
jgi:hypothetical protein